MRKHYITTIVSTLIVTTNLHAGETHKSPTPAKLTLEPELNIPVHPITGPFLHEDSFVGNDIRLIYAHHTFPGAILGGGRAQVAGVQLRYAITPSLQFVAYKDGWMDIDTPGLDAEGWNDLAAGIKWAFIQDNANKFHAAIGAGYEIAAGDDDVLQDDDELRIWASANKSIGKFNLGATANYLFALGNGDSVLGDSDMFSWHLHADYTVNKWFSPVVEVNGYHTTNEGSPVTPFSGADVLNLGGNNSEYVITGAVGAELRPKEWLSARAAWEFPISDNTDLFGHRWTFSAVIKF